MSQHVFAISLLRANIRVTHSVGDLLTQILAHYSVFHFPVEAFVLRGPKLSLCYPSTLSTTPMADIKTRIEVEPALINGSGKPVGGIEPVNISYCTMIF